MRNEAKILLWSSNLWEFGAGLLGPLYAVFALEIGGNILDISSAWATFLIVSGVLTILIGKIADQVGHKRLLLAGYILNTVFTFGYLLVDSPLDLFIVQIGLGSALALANPTWSALFDTFSTNSKEGYQWGLSYGQADIAGGIAIFLGGLIISMYSFATLFVLMGCMQILATLLQLRLR